MWRVARKEAVMRKFHGYGVCSLLFLGLVVAPLGRSDAANPPSVYEPAHPAEMEADALLRRGPSLQALHAAKVKVIALRAMVERLIEVAGHGERPHLENDVLAVAALLSIQSQLVDLGELIDKAIFAYPGPAYLAFVAQACGLTTSIKVQALTGVQVSLLPVAGLVTPADFQEIIAETNAVKNDLGCP